MVKSGTGNIAASAKARLLNLARSTSQDYNAILVRFALERLLYRLSLSEHANHFVLKGGMLVTAWIDDQNRVTRDLDFLGYGDDDPEAMVATFKGIMKIAADDGLIFDSDNLSASAIREEMEYGGVRLRTNAYLESTRIPVIIDIGFGDAMSDGAQRTDYPTLLDHPPPNVRIYPPASVIAEKFHAMVMLGVINGRMKDYYDIWAIPRSVVIGPGELDAAIKATFDRRQTHVPATRPPGLSEEMYSIDYKRRLWQAYATSIELSGLTFKEVIEAVWALVEPTCERLSAQASE